MQVEDWWFGIVKCGKVRVSSGLGSNWARNWGTPGKQQRDTPDKIDQSSNMYVFRLSEVSGYAQVGHANSMQKDPRPGFEPTSFLLLASSATNWSTVQTKSKVLTTSFCSQLIHKTRYYRNSAAFILTLHIYWFRSNPTVNRIHLK